MQYIYRFKNLINGKCYIGKSYRPELRKEEHINDAKKGSTGLFHKALRKYGPESFEFEIIAQAETLEEINELEKFHIIENNSCILDGDNGYNCTRGGDGFSSEETSIYVTERTARGENPFSRGSEYYNKNVQRIRDLVKSGNHHFQSEEHRKKVSEAQRKLVESGKHQLQDSASQSKKQRKRIEEGTFHMHQPEMKEHMRAKSLREVAEGNHNFVRVTICPHCGKEGKGPSMNRWHFDNCKMKNV
jgi:group I intron endonuclease